MAKDSGPLQNHGDLYIHWKFRHYIQHHEEDYHSWNDYLSTQKKTIYEQHLADLKKSQQMMGTGLKNADDIAKIYDAFIKFHNIPEAFWELVDGKLKIFNIDNRAMSIEALSKKIGAESNFKKLVSNLGEFTQQLKTKMNDVAKVLDDNGNDIMIDLVTNPRDLKSYNTLNEFINDFLDSINKRIITKDGTIDRVQSTIFEINRLIAGIEYFKWDTGDKDLVQQLITKVAEVMSQFIGDLGEIAEYYAYKQLEEKFIKELQDKGLGTEIDFKTLIVGNAQYNITNGWFTINCDAKITCDPNIKDIIKKIKEQHKAEKDEVRTTKNDVIGILTIDGVQVIFGSSVKMRTITANGKRSVYAGLQRDMKLLDGLELQSSWNQLSFQNYVYNVYGGTIRGDYNKDSTLGKQRDECVRKIVNYAGASLLLTALAGKSRINTQNMIGVLINRKFYPLTDILQQLINNETLETDTNAPIYVRYPLAKARKTYARTKVRKSKEQTNEDVAKKASSDKITDINAKLSDVKFNIRLHFTQLSGK